MDSSLLHKQNRQMSPSEPTPADPLQSEAMVIFSRVLDSNLFSRPPLVLQNELSCFTSNS